MRTLVKLFKLFGLQAGFRVWLLYLLKTAAKKFAKQDSDLLLLLGRLKSADKKGFIQYSSEFSNHKINLLFRKKTSDFSVFRQVFLQLEYRPLIEFIKSNKFGQRPIETIFDAGANIGMTSIFFHTHFPSAQIIAIEPEFSNYVLMTENLCRNCGENGIGLQGALWSKTKYLKLDKSFRDGLQWSYRMEEADETADNTSFVKGYALCDLLIQFSVSVIDILKIDVEGGETEIFKNASRADEFLSKTRFVAIETHDEVKSGPLVENALHRNHFIMFRSGETLFGANMTLNAI